MTDSEVAVITGGAGGIGRAICLEAARRGYRIAVVDYNQEAGDAVIAELLEITDAKMFVLNLADMDAITATVEEVANHFGRIDALVNAAAITNHDRVNQVTPERWDTYMEIVFKAQFFMAQQCAKHMSAVGGGRIVNVSSSMGYMADGKHTLYTSAKIGINGLTRNLAVDLWKDNIQVNSLLPSYVITPLVARHLDEPGWLDTQLSRILAPELLTPEQMADTCVFLLTCKTPFLNGTEVLAGTGYLDFVQKVGGPTPYSET